MSLLSWAVSDCASVPPSTHLPSDGLMKGIEVPVLTSFPVRGFYLWGFSCRSQELSAVRVLSEKICLNWFLSLNKQRKLFCLSLPFSEAGGVMFSSRGDALWEVKVWMFYRAPGFCGDLVFLT